MRRSVGSLAATAIALLATSGATVVEVASAVPAHAGGSRPPAAAKYCTPAFSGRFDGTRRGERESSIRLCTAFGTTLVVVAGHVPATCERKDGHTEGPERGTAVQIDLSLLRAPIGVGGSFAVTARSGARSSGIPRVPVSVRGVFDGTTVKGRVALTTGSWFVYTRCRADARFHAKIAR